MFNFAIEIFFFLIRCHCCLCGLSLEKLPEPVVILKKNLMSTFFKIFKAQVNVAKKLLEQSQGLTFAPKAESFHISFIHKESSSTCRETWIV